MPSLSDYLLCKFDYYIRIHRLPLIDWENKNRNPSGATAAPNINVTEIRLSDYLITKEKKNRYPHNITVY